jgi:hypothetical protein
MKIVFITLTFLQLIFSNFSRAIIPSNNFKFPIPTTRSLIKPVDESDFNEVADRLINIYSEFIKNNYNANFIINRNWADNTVNSYASRTNPNEFQIYIPGGIARAPGMTKNSLAYVLCHELGHHLGGAPKTHLFDGWPSAEGQADYWASSKCLKNYYADLSFEDVEISSNVPEKVISHCNKIYSNFIELKICVRSILAGIDFSNFLNQLPNNKIMVTLETPDPKIVKGTNINDYPRPQCRLDTIFQGALCAKKAFELTSPTDPTVAACNVPNELGARPACWFFK